MPKRSRVGPDRLRDLLSRRAGVVRVSELVALGMAKSTVYHRTRPGGRWRRLLPGVVQAFTGAASLIQHIYAALLYAGGGAMVTGLSALRLYGFRDLPPDRRIHLLLPHRSHRSSIGFVRVERTHRLPEHRSVRGVPMAPRPRAVMDAVREQDDPDTIRAIIAEAVQRRFCTIDELVVELVDAGTKRTHLSRAALSEVMAGVRSVAEAKVRRALIRAGIPQPLWNHHVHDAEGRWLAQPDGVWPTLGVILEIDSLGWHLSPTAYLNTQARQRRLGKYGLIVIPIAPTDLLNDPQTVLAELRDALHAAAQRPAPILVVRPPDEFTDTVRPPGEVSDTARPPGEFTDTPTVPRPAKRRDVVP